MCLIESVFGGSHIANTFIDNSNSFFIQSLCQVIYFCAIYFQINVAVVSFVFVLKLQRQQKKCIPVLITLRKCLRTLYKKKDESLGRT